MPGESSLKLARELTLDPPPFYPSKYSFCKYFFPCLLFIGAKLEMIPSMGVGQTGISFTSAAEVEAAGITWLEVFHRRIWGLSTLNGSGFSR